jgi:peptide/nickel transport system permease protein
MHSGARIASRLLHTLVTAFMVTVGVFLLVHIIPGNPAQVMAGPLATHQTIEAIDAQYHLNDPLVEQYILWLGGVLRGNLGISLSTFEPVTLMIAQHIGVTFTLALGATVLAIILSVPIGIYSAVRHSRQIDMVVLTTTSMALAVPNFFTGIILIIVFAVTLGWFSITGYTSVLHHPLSYFYDMTLPTVALSLPYVALLSRLVRSEMLEALKGDYVRTARAKGVAEFLVVVQHAFRNALIPAITIVALNFATLLGGTIIVEQVFDLPGMGSLLITSVLSRDYPVVQGVTLLVALAVLLANLLADLVVMAADPRVESR